MIPGEDEDSRRSYADFTFPEKVKRTLCRTQECLKKKKRKKKKRLVVHLGLRKVATTSIQAWLRECAETLRNEHSVLVLARSDHKYFVTWREVVYAFMNGKLSERHFVQKVDRQARKVRQWMLAQTASAILLSDENLFGARLYREINGTTLYDWAMKILPRIEAIWGEFFDVTFVLYLRRDELAWLRSCYNQEVKNNRLTLSYTEWAAKIPPGIDSWNDKFSSFASGIKSPFRTVFLGEEPHLGATLLQEVGVDCTRANVSPLLHQHLNESLPEAALEFMRAINQSSDISYTSKSAVGTVVDSMRHLFVQDQI
mmetsp:Transcript_2756/g.7233  ORF Transcript_2756/g.7233 Transcript_2756/m.7233 type:complete len:313 (-) Transcript_2756:850-1788(-)|eukprot:CAMPEP_0113552710 /NCGR_PEP_ID=MMETSP0015_2-20120614/15214_1 /TAXON_ID=2838 /ORGANISM="Odontella" /LENGTH=312 /DNA_ID=CAMNT_0000453709 /DNA_START=123 /DNA_END=1061 /DNA_ORIENTATION=- /assembly_acc=CAM_ASM_000160